MIQNAQRKRIAFRFCLCKRWLVLLICIYNTLSLIGVSAISSNKMIEAYDYIIVGGGAAGCSAAWYLIQQNYSVLVLERGKNNREISETLHLSDWPAVVNTEAAEMIRFKEGVLGLVGNTLGGGSSVNDVLYIEENIDYFKEIFNGSDINFDGLYLSYKTLADELVMGELQPEMGLAWYQALNQSGNGPMNDHSLPRVNGTWIPYTGFNYSQGHDAKSRWRNSAAELLHRSDENPYLTVQTQMLVHKIEMDKTQQPPRAIGVLVQNVSGCSKPCSRTKQLITATKAVLLMTGTIATPQLLMLSGIGPKVELTAQGIPILVENEFVGENFIDRQLVSLAMLVNHSLPEMGVTATSSNQEKHMFFESTAGGKVASELGKASAALFPPEERGPGVIELIDIAFKDKALADFINQAIEVVALQEAQLSRGRITLNSPNITGPPNVEGGYFTHPHDMTQQIIAIRSLLSIIDTPALREHARPKKDIKLPFQLPHFLDCILEKPTAVEPYAIVIPCLPHDNKVETLAKWAKDNLISSYHYFGTAALGKVVKTDSFGVIGTSGLYIADSSILPIPTRVNPMGTIMAMGHFAAKVIAKHSIHNQV